MPETFKEANNKSVFFRKILQEDIDCENLKMILSIRYYADRDRVFYIQIIFEID